MTVEEIFSRITARIIKGVMIHQELANYFSFLGLEGYELEQRKRYIDESEFLNKVNQYYVRHYLKLIPDVQIDIPKVIPNKLYKYNSEQLETNDITQAVSSIFQLWMNWEKETKQFYEECYIKLMDDNSAVEDALFVKCIVEDVGKELLNVKSKLLMLKSINFDILKIMEDQNG